MKISTAIRSTKQNLAEVINSSGLPASILTLITKEILRQLEEIEAVELTNEAKQAEKDEEREKKEESNTKTEV